MQMDQLFLGGVLFPVTPGKFTIKVNGKNKTVTLINEGEVSRLKTPGLSELVIDELLLPVQRYPFMQPKTKTRPAYYTNKLKKWMRKKKPVSLKLLRYESSSHQLLWDNDMMVSIESYEILEDAEKYGLDVCLKLNMKEYRPWGVKKLVLKEKKGKSGKKKTVATVKKQRQRTKEIAGTYKVKSGDTLMMIARKQLNDGTAWKKIYQLNEKTIEDTARKHGRKSSSNGHYLYVGTVLKLPGGGNG